MVETAPSDPFDPADPVRGPGRRGRTVLLAGAGHGHLALLRGAERLRRAGARLRVVAPGAFLYSGAASGVLSGEVAAARHRLDPGRWLRPEELVVGRVASIGAPGSGRVRLEDGRELRYDLLSLNLGSTCSGRFGPRAFRAKPLEELVELGTELDRLAAAGRGQPPHLVVVGGGASGCELALCGERRLTGVGPARVSLVVGPGGHAELLGPAYSARARRRVDRALGRRGVSIVAARAERARFDADPARSGTLELANGDALAFDALLDATGPRPPAWLTGSGWTGSDGGLKVDPCLRSIDDPRVFAVGDCASFRRGDGARLTPMGVHAVRQGPVLLGNLLAVLRGQPPRAYRPRRRALSILDLGDRTALATRVELACSGAGASRIAPVLEGRLAWRLKRFIDDRFLDR